MGIEEDEIELVPFRDSIAGQHGHFRFQGVHGVELGASEDHVAINLVSDYGYPIPLSQLQDSLEVLARVDGSGRVVRVVDDDGGRVVIDERFHVFQIDFPIAIGHQIVVAWLDSEWVHEGLVKREAYKEMGKIRYRPGTPSPHRTYQA